MALVRNPITGELEDDGLPESNPVTGETVEAPIEAAPLLPVDQSAQGAAGGAALGTPDNPMVATIAPHPRPPVEIVNQRQTPLPSADEKEAKAELDVANTLVQHATKNEGATAQEEAKINQQLADKKVELVDQQGVRDWEADQEDEREDEAYKTHVRTLTEDRARKQIAAGRARADYFKGNFVGDIVAALVQSVAAGLHAMQGKDGLSPAERIFEQKYQDHEKALLAEYEASKAAAQDFKNDRPRWDAEKAARRAKAARDALHDVNMAVAVADRSLAKLGPDKVANAQEMKQALEARANAKFDLELSKGLREIRKYEKTDRPMGDGSGDGLALSPKPPTEAEAKAGSYAQTILGAVEAVKGKPLENDTIRQMKLNIRVGEKPGGFLHEWAKATKLSPVPNGLLSGITDPDQKEIARQWFQMSEVRMRHRSGGAIKSEEMGADMDRSLPNEGDGPDQQERLRRESLDFAAGILPPKTRFIKEHEKIKAMESEPASQVKPKKPNWPEGERRVFEGNTYQMKAGKPVLVK